MEKIMKKIDKQLAALGTIKGKIRREMSDDTLGWESLEEEIIQTFGCISQWSKIKAQYNLLVESVDGQKNTLEAYRKILSNIKEYEKQFWEIIKQDKNLLISFCNTTIRSLTRYIKLAGAKNYREAIDEFGRAIQSHNEKEIKVKKKKMKEERNKVLILEEFLLNEKEKIFYIDKELKKTVNGARRAYAYARKYGDKFLN